MRGLFFSQGFSIHAAWRSGAGVASRYRMGIMPLCAFG